MLRLYQHLPWCYCDRSYGYNYHKHSHAERHYLYHCCSRSFALLASYQCSRLRLHYFFLILLHPLQLRCVHARARDGAPVEISYTRFRQVQSGVPTSARMLGCCFSTYLGKCGPPIRLTKIVLPEAHTTRQEVREVLFQNYPHLIRLTQPARPRETSSHCDT